MYEGILAMWFSHQVGCNRLKTKAQVEYLLNCFIKTEFNFPSLRKHPFLLALRSLNFIRLLRVVITPSVVERRKRLEAIGWISGYALGSWGRFRAKRPQRRRARRNGCFRRLPRPWRYFSVVFSLVFDAFAILTCLGVICHHFICLMSMLQDHAAC